MKLTIEIKDSNSIDTSLGISEERLIQILNEFSQEINRIQIKKERISITKVGKTIVDRVQPNENELLFIGIKLGGLMSQLAYGFGGATPVMPYDE
jgi:hypothetical protein